MATVSVASRRAKRARLRPRSPRASTLCAITRETTRGPWKRRLPTRAARDFSRAGGAEPPTLRESTRESAERVKPAVPVTGHASWTVGSATLESRPVWPKGEPMKRRSLAWSALLLSVSLAGVADARHDEALPCVAGCAAADDRGDAGGRRPDAPRARRRRRELHRSRSLQRGLRRPQCVYRERERADEGRLHL